MGGGRWSPRGRLRGMHCGGSMGVGNPVHLALENSIHGPQSKSSMATERHQEDVLPGAPGLWGLQASLTSLGAWKGDPR